MTDSPTQGQIWQSIARHGSGEPVVRKRGSCGIAAIVAATACLWIALATAPFNPWGGARFFVLTPGAAIATAAMLLFFPWAARRIHSRLEDAQEDRTFSYLREGLLWHALAGPLLLALAPFAYVAFAIGGGVGMAAYRWLNTGH
ncbi:MAG: hypothetical protein ACOY45_09030 [Pseudomonadota bacterium]